MVLLGLTTSALAHPTIGVSSSDVKPGDAVLVTVTGLTAAPKGTADGKPLELFPTRTGYQAVFAVPHDRAPGPIDIVIEDAGRPIVVTVREHVFPEASVVVEEEYANPGKEERAEIDADNKAIIDSVAKARGVPQFTRAFLRPAGKATSGFGVWRTFNDGHRSQHLGLDLAAKEGTPVKAINAGTVVLVRDTFLAGNVVVVAHGAGIASSYFHLSKAAVAEGDVVERGGRIGLAGQTGRTTGAHLHLAVHVPGGFVDPASFLRLKLAPHRAAH